MRLLVIWSLFLALLTGCSPQKELPVKTELDGQPVVKLEASPTYEAAASISLAEALPYEPWVSLEPDIVPATSMGDILWDAPLPDGTEVVCYWEADSKYTKYWAIRQEDGRLLRFCQEESAYPDGYAAEPFTNVLGQQGFRIVAPRGAAYLAYDYYMMDEVGIPHLLAACANDVIETDINSDGETELLWFYHGGRDIYYIFRREGSLHEVCLSGLLDSQEPAWLVTASTFNTLEAGCLPVHALQGGWAALSPDAHFLPGRLRFSEDTVWLDLESPNTSSDE